MGSLENFLERAGGRVWSSGLAGERETFHTEHFAKLLMSCTGYLLGHPQSFPEHCLGVSLQGVPALKVWESLWGGTPQMTFECV